MQTNMVFNKKIGLLFILLLINILGLIFLQFIVDTNIWLDIYFILWFFLSLITWAIIYIRLKEKNNEITLPFILAINLVFYALIDGIVRPGDEWFTIIWQLIKILLLIFVGFLLYSSLKPYAKKDLKLETFWRKYSKNKLFFGFCILLLFFLIFNQTIFIFPFTAIPVRDFKVDQNSSELEQIVDGLTGNLNSDMEKTIAIFEWFNSSNFNMFNTWRPPVIKNRCVEGTFLSLRGKLPYLVKVCVRSYDDSNPLWILTSRSGNCGEYARFFTEMAHRADLTVRTIHPNEMDHNWNEVLVDGANETWIIVDPSRFKFNPDPKEYENESGNFSYVYALRPWNEDQTKIDVTSNYTDVATVNVTTVDIYHSPVPNVDITVYSNNEGGGKTGLSFRTNETGYYQIEIGGGAVTFKCRNDSLVNSTRKTLFENEYYDVTIIMEEDTTVESNNDVLLNILVVLLIYIIIILVSLFFFRRYKKLQVWKYVRNACWIIGGALVSFATVVMDITLGTGGFAIFSLGFAIHSIVISLQSQERLKEMEREEIIRKLTMFQEENNSNIEFIDLLIKRKENYFPPKLLEKKLKQPKAQKFNFTPAELEQIADGGLWIPKGAFSYNYALQVIELAHHLDDSFINGVRNYIKTGEHLNVCKDTCHQWAIVRGVPNPSETNNYYDALDNVKKVTDKMKEMITAQLEKHKL